MAIDNSIVLYDLSGSLARITLNRPEKRNALSDELVTALKEALRRATHDDNVRAVILAGNGPDFCAGADLAALQKISDGSVAENLEDARSLMELFLLLRAVEVPVIAAVRGRALAGGCGLALACDVVLAARSARFGFPEVKIGFVPAMVLAILRRSASEKKAFELLTLGSEIEADDAQASGLVNLLIDDEAFDEEVEAFAVRFEGTSRSAVALTKRLLYQTDSLSFEDALECGVDTNVLARLSKDCQQGIEKFLRKRG